MDNESRKWEDLPPEVLGKIFEPLSIPEMFNVIPLVCKPWGEVVKGPYCWKEIDLDEWTSSYQVPLRVDRMLRLLITRSFGAMQKLCVRNLYDPSSIDFIAQHVGSLHTLKIPGCQISDGWIQNVSVNLRNLTYLDVSYCNQIGSAGLELIGRTCPTLTRLHRNMHPLDIQRKFSQEDETHAIATTMKNLEHLELQNGYVDTEDVFEIINCCSKIKYLDIKGCWNVRLDEDHLKQNFPRLHVWGPKVGEPLQGLILEYYWEFPASTDNGDGPNDYLGEDAAFVWPASP